MNENILLQKDFNTPFESFPFDAIAHQDYKPAFLEALKEAKKDIAKINEETAPADFKNTFVALEKAGEQLSNVSSVFFNLLSAHSNADMQALAQEISPLLSAHHSEILFDEKLFARIEEAYQNTAKETLTKEELMLLEETYRGFIENGAKLPTDKKDRLAKIDQEESLLCLQFGENLLKEAERYALFIENEKDLQGLPDFVKASAKAEATEKGKANTWCFTLAQPSYLGFMTYSENRALRKELFLAFSSKGFKNDDLDNQEIMHKIVQLRSERAEMLGHKNYAEMVLKNRMAKNKENVFALLDKLKDIALPLAKKEWLEIENYAKKLHQIDRLERWDFAYYSEKLKKEKFNLDDEALKPYFSLEKTVQGMFEVAKKLYGISFVERADIPLYHQDVKTYQVFDKNSAHLALFYADFFPRGTKRSGAWMTNFKSQSEGKRPHVAIVCNFTKPTATEPSLLTFDEVLTLFHEFGHALHGMFGMGKFASLSGTSVKWDFVELPSQIMENWCYEKECLDLFATHYQTGEKIPNAYLQSIKDSANFLSAYQTIRQLSFSYLDLSWHALSLADAKNIQSVGVFENAITENLQIAPSVEHTSISCAFSHVFQGEYAAGYYSYKWAEVLDADAFELFLEKGIFDEKTAESFRENILSKGGSEDPMVLYKRFRGAEPSVEALLKRSGLA
jgi:peptidyl-dipeptidase Dcp